MGPVRDTLTPGQPVVNVLAEVSVTVGVVVVVVVLAHGSGVNPSCLLSRWESSDLLSLVPETEKRATVIPNAGIFIYLTYISIKSLAIEGFGKTSEAKYYAWQEHSVV